MAQSPTGGGPLSTPRVLLAVDKFRSTASASDIVVAVGRALATHDVPFDAVALSDGGEGFRSAFEGPVAWLSARGAWGDPHDVPLTVTAWDGVATGILEVAEIIGRSPQSVDSATALAASSAGVGEALLAAARRGVAHVVIGCGGSATSDGGEGCYDVVRRAGGLGVRVSAATDITAPYAGALRYAEQKGVARDDLAHVAQRLATVRERLRRETGLDPGDVARTGAAGGLAGALYALGADVVSGFDAVATAHRLASRVAGASLVVTGEGRLDAGSLEGKVVTGVCALTRPTQRVLVVCGSVEESAADTLRARHPGVEIVDLVSRFGESRSFAQAAQCVADVVTTTVLAR